MNYEIHPMSIEDYDEVIRLWKNTEGIKLTESNTKSSLEGFLKRNPELSFVARINNNKIIGAVLCGHDGARGYIRHLAVSSNYRRIGIGKALTEKCLSRLKSLGIRKCTIFLLAHNKEGQYFWIHNNWFNRDDLMVMQKHLLI